MQTCKQRLEILAPEVKTTYPKFTLFVWNVTIDIDLNFETSLESQVNECNTK